MTIRARRVRHREFDLLRHSERFLGFLGEQATRLTGTSALEFTVVTASNNLVFATNQDFATAEGPFTLTVSSGGTLPAGLAADTDYWVRRISATNFTLHTSAADATANTGVVGITDTGTGTFFFSAVLEQRDIFASLKGGKTAQEITNLTTQDNL